jgi:hypothetical protein
MTAFTEDKSPEKPPEKLKMSKRFEETENIMQIYQTPIGNHRLPFA